VFILKLSIGVVNIVACHFLGRHNGAGLFQQAQVPDAYVRLTENGAGAGARGYQRTGNLILN